MLILGSLTTFTPSCKDSSESCPNIPPPKLQVPAEEPIDRQDPFVWTDLSLLEIKQEAYTLVSLCQKERANIKAMYEKMYLSQMMPLPE